ncbi:zinc finger matrin-type protein 5 [Fopius arisanus]|uniref:ZMAT5 protein n=1 Tax=Fopius arisanus TaxID=64838 RepID=A0A0C9RAL3_9HYME|nr:PREDICTED: zinc finger matrin-type protein 5 [Fopius arisanus]
MGKRYHCDYCDRSFKDNSEIRKKHLSSLQHAKNYAEHYRQFKDPEEILREESTKIPCKKTTSENGCPFGNSCRFSHYTAPMMWELERIVWLKQRKESKKFSADIPNPLEIITEFFQNPLSSTIEETTDRPIWNIPPHLKTYSNLPPSLWPITPASVTDSNFTKWG